MDPKGLLVGEDKIEEQRRIEIFTNAYIKYYPKIVEEIADTWDTIDRMGGKKGIFALGLRRAIDLKLFVPHLVEQKAEFYKETLGEVEYKKLRKRFKVLTSDPVFYQFLPFGREYRIFEVQRGMRAPKEQ